MASISLNAGTFYGNGSAIMATAGTGLIKSCAWDDFVEFIDMCHVPALVFVGDSDSDGYDRPIDIIRHWRKRSYDFFDKILTSEKFFITYVCDGAGKNFAYYIAKDYSGDAIDVLRFIGVVAGDDYPRLCLYWKKQNGAVTKKVLSYGVAYPSGDSEMMSEMNQTFAEYSPLPWYTITYDANGAQQSDPDGTTAASGEKVRLSDVKMTMIKFEFAGWEIDGTVYEAGSEYTLVKSVVAKATWQRKVEVPGNHPDGDESQQASPQDQKIQYAIPGFDPSNENIPNSGATAVDKSEFPLYHTYASEGGKYIRASSNISALSLNGEEYNGIRTQLRAAYLNKRITEVSPSCFANCSLLTAINADNNIKAVGDYAFYGCTSLRGISFLGEQNKELRRIGDYAFARSGLQSVKVNLVGSVDDSAMHSHCFASCDSLEQVDFINSTYLGDHQFDGCSKLQRVFLNNYHSYVSEYCFANCTALRKIDLPAKTYMLSPHMFDGCANLTAVNFAEGADLRQLGDAAFAGCSRLTSITLPASVSSLNFIDQNFLSGSSISRVVFNGMDDDVFAEEYEDVVDLQYETNKWYWEPDDITNIVKAADELHIPVVAGSGLPFCDKCKDTYGYSTFVVDKITKIDVSSIDFTKNKTFNNKDVGDYLKQKNCFWLFGVKYGKLQGNGWNATYTASYDAMMKALNATWRTPTTVIHWKKEDGTLVNDICGGMNNKNYWLRRLQDDIGEYSGSQTETKVRLKSSITTFGRGEGMTVTYVSKTGNEYVCSNDSIEHVPETKVDKETVDDFRYGIWYYNAREMKTYADEHGLPALFEYSSTACDPCRDFRKSTFDSQEFQSEIQKRPCLFSRVEIGEGEYFDHPTTTQAYYVSHTLNKENTYIPCLVYYWKKPDGSVYQKAWNYNYRTDPANANYETVLSKLDAMLGDYSGDDRYWPPDIAWSGNGKFQYYPNEDGDENGRYFICDEKTQVSRYSGELDIDLDTQEGLTPLRASTLAAGPFFGTALQQIETGRSAGVPDYTYQYYTTTGSDAQYNTRGVIFKVADGIVQYIFEFRNENSAIPDSGKAQYSAGNSYQVGSATGFQQVLDECRSHSIPMVILESPSGETEFDRVVKSSAGFGRWLRSSPYVMVEIRLDDWSSAAGQAVRQFESSVQFHGNSTSDQLPKLLVYHGCSTCTADGSIVTYCRRKIDIQSGKDYQYYTALLDAYADECE